MGMMIVGRRYATALVLAVVMTIMPLTSASLDADASVIPQIDVLILPHVAGANVTGTEPDTVTFEGTYEVDQLRAMTSQDPRKVAAILVGAAYV